LKLTDQLSISHESIYQHIWWDKDEGGDLYKHLRCAQKRRRKRYGAYDSRGRLAGKRPIEERPVGANTRSEFGHWEIDLVHGKGSKDCIVTLVERKTRYTLIGKLKAKTKEQTNARTLHLIAPRQETFKTITSDNGTEFHGFAEIEKKMNLKFYFANPYHSWERGTNENTNGLIRQYLPKKESMASITQATCNSIAKKLNSRPRKILGYKTPQEAFNAEL
jgi:IS30 family transposase